MKRSLDSRVDYDFILPVFFCYWRGGYLYSCVIIKHILPILGQQVALDRLRACDWFYRHAL